MSVSASIVNGFKPAGTLNTHLMREVRQSRGVYVTKCRCGMEYSCHVAVDPRTTLIKMRSDGKVEIKDTFGLPIFGHFRENCAGAGAPLSAFGIYTWDGSMWCS